VINHAKQLTPELLYKSATAISLLTNKPVAQDSPIHDAESRAEIVRETSHQLFMLINHIRTLLHNQVNDLLSEGVIPAETTRFVPAPTAPAGMPGPASTDDASKNLEANVTNGGLGKFDIAELNARAGIKQQGDEEFLARLRGILDELKKRAGEEGDSMVVDS
jgi:hypothetical protein